MCHPYCHHHWSTGTCTRARTRRLCPLPTKTKKKKPQWVHISLKKNFAQSNPSLDWSDLGQFIFSHLILWWWTLFQSNSKHHDVLSGFGPVSIIWGWFWSYVLESWELSCMGRYYSKIFSHSSCIFIGWVLDHWASMSLVSIVHFGPVIPVHFV